MKSIRIGNAQAFWGDRADVAAEMLAREPDLDYLTLDYLAEVSMSILALQRERDPQAGFARDFVDVVRSLVPYWNAGGRCRLIANAGGLNPSGCAEVCRKTLEDSGCRALRIGVVSGDDVLETLRSAATSTTQAADYRNLDSGAPLEQVRGRLVTANAYLGAGPIREALAAGADLVITGRVADPSLTVAACLHHFGWRDNDLDCFAGATVAGHLIECGTQVTGGISTDWLDVPDPAHIGFPIVEVSEDGSCIVTKPRGTGGRVNTMTVKEQLLYEIGDPGNYLSPDVAVSFLSLEIDDLGNDRVQVSGATGKPRPTTYKVSATYRDGFWSCGTLTIIGRRAKHKAQRVGELVANRVREAGLTLRETVIEVLGGRAHIDKTAPPPPQGFEETVLRVAVESDSRDAVECFSRQLMPFITAGPQGTTGYAEGRPRVHPLFRYWPCLIAREAVVATVDMLPSPEPANDAGRNCGQRQSHPSLPITIGSSGSACADDSLSYDIRNPSHLYDIAIARSGDKGTSVNIGVIARATNWWEFLRQWLTSSEVVAYLAPGGIQYVDRYELPNLQALNFVIHGALQQSLRTDAQGKALGQILLEMPLPVDAQRQVFRQEG